MTWHSGCSALPILSGLFTNGCVCRFTIYSLQKAGGVGDAGSGVAVSLSLSLGPDAGRQMLGPQQPSIQAAGKAGTIKVARSKSDKL